MSENWIALIPTDPHFVPTAERRDQARDALARIAPGADEVKVVLHDEVQFFDCGENFEAVRCPSCGATIDTEWWQGRMDDDFDGGFKLASYPTPCCGVEVMLNQLNYDWPQGFARFAIDAMNPDVGKLTDDQVEGLSELIGHPLRVIYQHI